MFILLLFGAGSVLEALIVVVKRGARRGDLELRGFGAGLMSRMGELGGGVGL